MNITIHYGHIDHRHGYDHHAATSHEDLIKWAAEYCRESWSEQFNEDDPDDAIPETDDQIVEKYFERAGDAGMGDGEYFHHDMTQIEIPDPIPAPIPRFPIGTQYLSRGKNRQDICTVTDFHITRNLAGEIVKTCYVSTHPFMGQTITDYDVPASTIARNIIEKPA